MKDLNFSITYTEKAVVQYCTRRILSNRVFFAVFFAVIIAGILACSLFLALSHFSRAALFILVILAAIGVVIPLALLLIPRRVIKTQSGLVGTKQNYCFLTDSLVITSLPRTGDDRAAAEKISEFPYEQLFSVWEAKNAYYFYPDKGLAYIFDTAQLSAENAQALKEHLHHRIKKEKFKYI